MNAGEEEHEQLAGTFHRNADASLEK